MVIDEILKYNEEFVENKGYVKYLADKYPVKKLAILTCMDTRLTTMLPAALGLRNGDAKIIKNAGGVIPSPTDSVMRSLLVGIYELEVKVVMVIAHSDCGACHLDGKEMKRLMQERGISQQAMMKFGVKLEQWLEGFHDTPKSVRATVELIRNHPLVPRDIEVRGFIIDSVTGKLTPVD